MTLTFLILLSLIGLVGLVLAFVLFRQVRGGQLPDETFGLISKEIRRTLMAFLARGGLVLAGFLLFTLFILLRWSTPSIALTFLAGAVLSVAVVALCALMATATVSAALRAAGESGTKGAAEVAFSGAGVCGLVTASIGLISLSLLYYLVARGPLEPIDLAGFVLGGSVVSLFCRLSGGLFSKAATLTSNLVGRFEPSVAPDNRHNPAAFAVRAGDHASRLCGATTELLEVWGGAVVATVLIASSGLSTVVNITNENRADYMSLPVIVAGIGLGASIISLVSRYLFWRWEPGSAFRLCHLAAAIILLVGAFLYTNALELELGVFYALLLGVISALVVGLLTEWYTSGPPIRRIAGASATGVVTNILAGFTVGMQSTALPILTISGAILIAYNYAGVYGIGIAAVGMLATLAGWITVSAYGPITDGATGVASLAGAQPAWVGGLARLHFAGNSNTAIGKSLIVGASTLAAMALLAAYSRLVGLPSIDLVNPTVIVGFFLGGILPFFLSDAIITSIGKTTFLQIEESRRQFEEIAGLREGTQSPDSARFAAIGAWAALKEMPLPLLVSVASPIIIALVLGRSTLAGMMAGSLTSAVLLALFMTHSGTAWDNARNFLALGAGSGSADQFVAAYTGELVGDPLKDACGPAVIVLVRLMAVSALIACPLLT